MNRYFPSLCRRISALLGLFSLHLSPVSAETWDSILPLIRKRFPDVAQLSTARLADWLKEAKEGAAPLIVDVREEKERAVSHLPGAVPFESVDQVRAAQKPGQAVVVYCSVGYRSSVVAEKLGKAGLKNVWNLEGSIFAWANEGRPVYRGTTKLEPAKVHPYDKKWGQLLKAELRAPL